MKKNIWKISTVFVAMIVIFVSYHFGNKEDHVLANSDSKTIIASGIGEVSLEPDVAYVHIGAQVVAETANDAQREVSKKIDAIRAVIKQYNVKDKNVRTAYFHVYPYEQYGPNGEMKVEKYRAEHALEITFTDLNKLGEFIDATSKAGANRIDQIRFGLQNPEKAEHEALTKAIENAKAKADVMAKAVNKTRGDVIQISDRAANIQFPFADRAQFNLGTEQSLAQPTSIEAGEVKVTKHVDVIYQMN